MNNLTQSSPFDSIRHQDEQGEYWMSRELMPILGYPRWSDFKDAIERAKRSCENASNPVAEHFSVLFLKNPSSSQGRKYQDYKLSRYACYLVAMNGDPRKPEIAQAQAYFTAKIREAETIIPAQNAEIEKLKLQLAIAQANATTTTNQRALLERSEAIVTIHGAPMLALIQGRPDAVVEKVVEVREVVLCTESGKPIAHSKGISKTALAKELGLKKAEKLVSWLKSMGKEDLLIEGKTALPCQYVPYERLEEVKRLWASQQGERQRLIGE